jgi:hypothetical protein
MLLLLYGIATGFGQVLMVVALICFVLAFIYGRRHPDSHGHHADHDDGPESGA